MKKFYISILSLVLCTSPVISSAKTISPEEIATQIKENLNICESATNKISLKDFLEKFGICTDGNFGETLPEIDSKPESAPENNTKPESTPDANSSFEYKVLELVNEERQSRGLTPLTYSYELSSVAKAHSEDMAKRGYFSHNTPEGLTPFDRMKNAGISYKSAGENIAAGQQTPEAVVEAWMNSDGHRKNILNSSYREMGIGISYGGSYGIYWTQLFKS